MSKSTISTFELFQMFPDQESARAYFEARRWPDGATCPACGEAKRWQTPPKQSIAAIIGRVKMLAEIKRMPTEGAQETATLLRELADKLEEGKCRNIVVVADLTEEQSYIRSADWQDAWRLLGAIEYAKSAILGNYILDSRNEIG